MRGALETGTALEVNNSSLIKKDRRINCCENYRSMLKWCEQLGVPVIVNSDAHDPSGVGRVELAMALLEEIAFPDSLILNLDSDKLLSFLLA